MGFWAEAVSVMTGCGEKIKPKAWMERSREETGGLMSIDWTRTYWNDLVPEGSSCKNDSVNLIWRRVLLQLRRRFRQIFVCVCVCCSIEHLGLNMAMQLLVGVPLEMVHGALRIGLVYVCGVLAGRCSHTHGHSQTKHTHIRPLPTYRYTIIIIYNSQKTKKKFYFVRW